MSKSTACKSPNTGSGHSCERRQRLVRPQVIHKKHDLIACIVKLLGMLREGAEP